MVVNKKLKLQKLKFGKAKFPNKSLVRRFIKSKGYKLDKRLKWDVANEGNVWSVRQINPDYFRKSTLKEEKIDIGVRGVFGYLK